MIDRAHEVHAQVCLACCAFICDEIREGGSGDADQEKNRGRFLHSIRIYLILLKVCVQCAWITEGQGTKNPDRLPM